MILMVRDCGSSPNVTLVYGQRKMIKLHRPAYSQLVWEL